ncbi:LLM class flavin-dependent oxidoreductase [Paenibacillus lycopersici]|uniref:LLM class flavin-dependent oxidoreductase n=1 Tax=Paenibacillus lycopersici TaxID=2704462 RepID=A0A6C0FPQ4_9BACL|nr:LLM class flavin-dependent oxidoreductase [Paenibacillus lycopersici]QHT59108.1 LLM class flavin-dependent oxidoreductase [Paenibacillus lycopersici]
MTDIRTIPLAVLDLAPVVEGGTPAESFRRTLELAQLADRLGYNRYWLAEHHNMAGIASSATSVVIGYVAGGTKRIRVGSGGIMLPNHAPLVIAEQFGTLESMYPGRIDLGLGRAPGSDQTTARALRRDLATHGQDFPELLAELRGYFNPPEDEYRPVRATPGEGLSVPIWLLGSSGFSAKLAGELGLPFSFASHFAPEYLMPAIHLYRSSFRPSPALDKPYVMIGVNIVAADTDEEAKRLATSQQQQFLSLIRGRPGKLKPPVDNMDDLWQPHERDALQSKFQFGVAGSRATVQARLQQIIADTMADELIVTSQIYDHQARLHSYEIIAEAGNIR